MEEIKIDIKFPRITVVDALRGFAVMSIMLLHNIEHFDYYYFPDYLPQWMKTLDKHVWETMFALFSGKAYAIFAILFGFTFFLMDSKQKAQGKPFGARFMWRMLFLFIFGIFNSMFYSGDVLAIYAVLGFTLLMVNGLKNKTILIIASLLILQPFEIARFIYMLLNPQFNPGNPLSWQFFGQSSAYLASNSFLDTAWGNVTNGRWACTLWTWEHGRFFQIPGLFMVGLVLGRTRKIENSESNKIFWKKILIVSLISGAVIVLGTKLVLAMMKNNVLAGQFNLVIETWNSFAFTFVWISAFVLLYATNAVHKLLSRLEVFGKMSLTNYVMQSMMGCFVYNGCGLALYKYTGASLSLMVGIVLFIVQFNFCKWWLKRHKQGPLESIWHNMTWINFKKSIV
jgi:uncharacterized protein